MGGFEESGVVRCGGLESLEHERERVGYITLFAETGGGKWGSDRRRFTGVPLGGFEFEGVVGKRWLLVEKEMVAGSTRGGTRRRLYRGLLLPPASSVICIRAFCHGQRTQEVLNGLNDIVLIGRPSFHHAYWSDGVNSMYLIGQCREQHVYDQNEQPDSQLGWKI